MELPASFQFIHPRTLLSEKIKVKLGSDDWFRKISMAGGYLGEHGDELREPMQIFPFHLKI